MAAARGSQPDPYELLGVRADASGTDISRAYRRLARALHPDSRPGDPAAADQFLALTRAYHFLSGQARHAASNEGRSNEQRSNEQRPGHQPPSRPPAAASAGQIIPPVWPLDRPLTGPPATPPPAPARTALWAGPVIVEPPPSGEPDGLADLIARLRTRRSVRPW